MDNKSRKKKVKKITYTKKVVSIILAISLFDLQLSYVLAWFGKPETAINLSITICTEIVAVILGYLVKSYKETKEEERVKLKRELMEYPSSPDEEFANKGE